MRRKRKVDAADSRRCWDVEKGVKEAAIKTLETWSVSGGKGEPGVSYREREMGRRKPRGVKV
jgi:hypothetical protein